MSSPIAAGSKLVLNIGKLVTLDNDQGILVHSDQNVIETIEDFIRNSVTFRDVKINSFRSVGERKAADGSIMEPTVIVELDFETLSRYSAETFVGRLSIELKQDAIAWKLFSEYRGVSGPNAKDWGPFNPGYFTD